METFLINQDYVIDFEIPDWLMEDIKELEDAIARKDVNLDVYQDYVSTSINLAMDILTPIQIDTLRKRYWL